MSMKNCSSTLRSSINLTFWIPTPSSKLVYTGYELCSFKYNLLSLDKVRWNIGNWQYILYLWIISVIMSDYYP